jgi:hypothetical protein
MTDPYRHGEDRLGAEERESDAVREFGQWRDRTRTRILAAFSVAGILLGGAGYYFGQELQFRWNHGVALIHVNVMCAALPLMVMFFVGALVGRAVVRRRTDAKVRALAARYEIPVERLADVANLVHRL